MFWRSILLSENFDKPKLLMEGAFLLCILLMFDEGEP